MVFCDGAVSREITLRLGTVVEAGERRVEMRVDCKMREVGGSKEKEEEEVGTGDRLDSEGSVECQIDMVGQHAVVSVVEEDGERYAAVKLPLKTRFWMLKGGQ